jgi:hypothetical protein
MRNCLRFGAAEGVAGHGAIGTVFIVGLYDVPSGKALSTAEIKLVVNRNTGGYRLITKQHTAMANRNPSGRCHCALREFLLYRQTDAVREHLGNSWKKLRRLRSENGAQAVNLPAALRCALGEQVYEELLGRVRSSNDPANAGAAPL